MPFLERIPLTRRSVAGTDTTATTMRVAMLYVMTSPPIYKKLQAEIDSTTRDGRIITDEHARTLVYLQAVIKEAARLCPPATGILSKKTPPQGDTVNGRFIPGGVEIGQCIWAVERSKEVFGQDSAMFRPERWLEAKGKQLEKMEKSVNLVWGYGKYSCLGKHIAYLELNKVFFEVSRLAELRCGIMKPANLGLSF
jgi:cytochrome P450